MGETTTSLGRLLLEGYIQSLRGQHLRSATVSSRQRCLRSIDGGIGLENVSPASLETLGDLRQWSPGTRYAYASCASLFTRWAVAAGLMDSDPFEAVRKPRQPRYRPRPITIEQLRMLLERLATPYRSWAVLAAYAGLRREEICKVRGVDLVPTLTGYDLVVPDGKGGKADAIPAHQEVVDLFKDSAGEYLFLTRTGRPYTPGHLGELASHAFAAVGVKCGLHQLRHLFGTQLYANTHDVYAVKRALRHDSIRSTEVYVAADVSWIREAVCAL